MATQLIQVPRHLIDALLSSALQERWLPGDNYCPHIAFEAMLVSDTSRAVAVIAPDLALAWDDWSSHGSKSVFVLLLTTDLDLDRAFQPRPLPAHLVVPIIKATASAACSVMTGHDALEFSSVLDVAASAPNSLPLPPISRSLRSRFERRLRETALCLQGRFTCALEPLREEIASYGESLLRSRLGPVIDSLSTEGAVADYLALRPDSSSGCLRMVHNDPSSVVSLMNKIQQARAVRKAARWVLEDLVPYGAHRRQPLSAFHVAALYRHGFADIAPDHSASFWRRHDPKYSEFPVSVPAVGIEAAMLRFADAFDQRLLGDVDPIVISVLACYHLLRVQPVGRSDRDVAELLLHVLLRQAGLPPMPLPMVMYRRYWEHAHILQVAMSQGQVDCLADTIIAAMKEALKIAKIMIDRLGAERQRLRLALAETGMLPFHAGTLTTDLLSNVLVRRWSSPELVPAGSTYFESEMLPACCRTDRYGRDGQQAMVVVNRGSPARLVQLITCDQVVPSPTETWCSLKPLPPHVAAAALRIGAQRSGI